MLEPSSNVIKVLFRPKYSRYSGYAKVYQPHVAFNKFIPIVALDESGEIISNSNSFLVDSNFCNNNFANIKEYDDIHGIFTGIETVSKNLRDLPAVETIEQPMFLLCNPFSGRNAGHDLSILFNRIHIYRTLGLQIPVVVSQSMNDFPLTLDICKVLLPSIEFHILPSDRPVEFRNLMITENVVFDINLHRGMHREIIDYYTRDMDEKCLNRKVCLIKNTAVNKNIVSSWSAFHSISLMKELEEKYNYVVINPEQIDTRSLVCYLYKATKILVSYGGIMYVNQIFFNPGAQLYYIDKSGQTPYFYASRYKRVTPEHVDLDYNISGFLKMINEID